VVVGVARAADIAVCVCVGGSGGVSIVLRAGCIARVATGVRIVGIPGITGSGGVVGDGRAASVHRVAGVVRGALAVVAVRLT